MLKKYQKYFAVFSVFSLLAVNSIFSQTREESSNPLDLFSAGIADAASVDYFLKIDGIDGEATDDQHKNWIQVESFSFGAQQSGTSGFGGGGGAGKVTFQDVHFSANTSKASPKLMLAVANGQHIKEVRLQVRKAGSRQHFLEIKLTDIIVSSYQASGNSGAVPTDSVSMNYAKVEFEYRPQKADGSLDSGVKAGWDIKANKKI